MIAAVRAAAGPRVAGAAFPAAVAVALLTVAAGLARNALLYPWVRGYDAWAVSKYTEAIRTYELLPSAEYSSVWHHPPVFYVFAARLQEVAVEAGLAAQQYDVVQLANAAFGVGVVVFAFLVARELAPSSRTGQLGALAFAALAPPLARASVMYHPEPLATLFAAAGTWVVVRGLARGTLAPAHGAAAGVLLGLGVLTRQWAGAVAGALLLALVVESVLCRRREVLGAAALFAVVFSTFLAPWLAHQHVRRGAAFAFARPAPAEPLLERRPREFFVSLPVHEMFAHPYAPSYPNQLLPVLYTDWWGDYWRSYGVPEALANEPPRLPDRLHRDRVLQSYVGLLPTGVAAGGLVLLAVGAVRRRAATHVALLASLGALAVTFLLFQIAYPSPDGDTIKATYLLNAVLPLAVAFGTGLAAVRRAGRLVFLAVLLLLVDVAYLDLRFLLLPGS